MKIPYPLLSKFGLLGAMFMAPTALAAISISLPANTEPLLFNAQTTDATSLTAEDGQQQIVFKYLANFRHQGQSQRFISDAVIVTFTGQNAQYSITLPKINSASDADKFNQHPRVGIIDDNGQQIDYRIDTLTKDGIQVGRNYREEINQYNLSAAPAAIKMQPQAITTSLASSTTSLSATQVSATGSQDNPTQINVGQMLDFWYQQADEKTRQAFKAKINAVDSAKSK